MRVLIDECLNCRLARGLPGHYAVSVQRMGWSGTTNGELLALAERHRFDVFLSGDRNLSFQQAVSGLGLAVIVLAAEGTKLHQTMPLMPKVLAILPSLKVGQIVWVNP